MGKNNSFNSTNDKTNFEEAPKQLIKNEEHLNRNDRKEFFSQVMDRYRKGKEIAKQAEKIIRGITKLDSSTKLPNVIIQKVKVPEAFRAEYDHAVNEYNQGMQMTLDAKSDILQQMDNFIYYVIERRFPTFKIHTNDLYQEGVVGILKGIDSYDPKVSLPTTYFYIYIIHEMTEFINININRTTSHYSSNIMKVKKAADLLERNGREWSLTDIAQETRIPVETVLQTLRLMEYTKEKHYDSVDYLDSQMTQNVPSPETEYIKAEANEILYQAVAELPKEEAAVIILKYGEGLTYKKIGLRLNKSIDQVKRLKNLAIRRLRDSEAIQNSFQLSREEWALNANHLGMISEEIGEKLMEQLLKEDR